MAEAPRTPRAVRTLIVSTSLWTAVLGAGCATPGAMDGRSTLSERPARDTDVGPTEEGIASWYGREHHGKPTANGERFDMNALTAAHRRLRFGTRARVTNLRNGRRVVVRINDRGPFTRGRIIDVSRAAALELDMVEAGVVPVRVEPLR